MAELVIERFTRCPTGNPKDEIFFEIVLQDDDVRPLQDPTPRVTNLVRLVTRGDPVVLRDRLRDILVTIGRGGARTIQQASRISDQHLDVDLTGLGLTLTLPRVRGVALGAFDVYAGPAKGDVPPTKDLPFDTYKGRSRKVVDSDA